MFPVLAKNAVVEFNQPNFITYMYYFITCIICHSSPSPFSTYKLKKRKTTDYYYVVHWAASTVLVPVADCNVYGMLRQCQKAHTSLDSFRMTFPSKVASEVTLGFVLLSLFLKLVDPFDCLHIRGIFSHFLNEIRNINLSLYAYVRAQKCASFSQLQDGRQLQICDSGGALRPPNGWINRRILGGITRSLQCAQGLSQ